MDLSHWFRAVSDGIKCAILAGGKRRNSVWARRSICAKEIQELETRCLLSAVPGDRPKSIEEVIAMAPVSEAGVIQVNAFGLMDLNDLTPMEQSQLIYGPMWQPSASQTPVEDLYDEGAGAVWGSLSDEGSVAPTSLFDCVLPVSLPEAIS